MKDNRDGTYYIKFEDGDKDLEVPKRSIKTAGGNSPPSKSRRDDDDDDNTNREGDKVEAKCKGSTNYYAGKVREDNHDGTYDVSFDDGDRNQMVPKRSIKKGGGGGGGGRASDDDEPREGAKVEAKCKGSTEHYPGKIYRDNGDGTFHLKFDDGDSDRTVPKRSIKVLSSQHCIPDLDLISKQQPRSRGSRARRSSSTSVSSSSSSSSSRVGRSSSDSSCCSFTSGCSTSSGSRRSRSSTIGSNEVDEQQTVRQTVQQHTTADNTRRRSLPFQLSRQGLFGGVADLEDLEDEIDSHTDELTRALRFGSGAEDSQGRT
jgi:hypothetical protein